MVTVPQQRVLEYLAANPGATTTEIIDALFGADEHGELVVSICLAALEKKGLVGADNRIVTVELSSSRVATG
jgi:hypothetical protein